MPRSQLIIPRADAGCGKVFYDDRRTADQHRIALEFWNQATGQVREGYHLAVYCCKRCGGFHISQRPIAKACVHPAPHSSHPRTTWDGADEYRPEIGLDSVMPITLSQEVEDFDLKPRTSSDLISD